MQKICYILIGFGLFTACNSDQSTTTTSETTSTRSATIKSPEDPEKEANQALETEDPEPDGPNFTIEPGNSVGLLKINEQAQVIYKLLGKPDKSDAAMGKMLATWITKPGISEPDSIPYQTNIFFARNLGRPDPESQAKQIRVTSPVYRLPNRMGVNSNLETIKNYYPEMKKTGTYSGKMGKITVYHDVKAGIAFEIDAAGKCRAITIQEPGEQNYEVYSAVSTDFKRL